MIEDRELSQLFQAESEEHLRILEDGLLALESEPSNKALLEGVFRAAHSLKGNARMLGLREVEVAAHTFEETLGAVRRGQVTLTAEAVDGLCRNIDGLRRSVIEAVTGVTPVLPFNPPPPTIAVPPEPTPEVIEGPSAAEPVRSEPAALSIVPPQTWHVTAAPTNDGGARSAPPMPPSPAVDTNRDSPGTFKIDTIRVEPEKLDRLMTIAGELTVTTSRVARGMADWEALAALREEWGREIRIRRTLLRDIESQWKEHAAYKRLLGLQEQEQERWERLDTLLGRVKQLAYEDVTRLENVTGEMGEAIQSVRLMPFTTIFGLFPRMVRDLIRTQSKELEFLIEGAENVADKRILEEMKDPLMHMIRNSVDHGIESPEERVRRGKPRSGTIRLRVQPTASHIVLELEDDGRGLDVDAIRRTALKRGVCREDDLAVMTEDQVRRLIFEPGFSTSPLVTDVSGRGVGMDVVHANVERLKGSIEIESEPGRGCRFRIYLPLTLATTRVLLVQAGGQTFALPVEHVDTALLLSASDIFRTEGRDTICRNGEPISLASLAHLLQLAPSRQRLASSGAGSRQPCILLKVDGQLLGLVVDGLIDEQQVLIKPLGPLLRRVPNLSGATILGTGAVCLVLNPSDLIKAARQQGGGVAAGVQPEVAAKRTQKTILLSEDSITTRTQEKRILEGAGYAVVTAVDGLDAFQKLGTRQFDAVVSDVEMPNMDGWALAARIRAMPQYKELPIVLVTSLASDEDRRRGVDVGASAYITKGTFNQNTLLEALRRLV